MPRYEMSAAEYRGEGSESSWRATVKDMARAYGWVVLFELPDKGYATLARAAQNTKSMIPVMLAVKAQPDLLLGHPDRGIAIAVELKVPGKKPMPHQQEKLNLYDACGVATFVWETGCPSAEIILREFHKNKRG